MSDILANWDWEGFGQAMALIIPAVTASLVLGTAIQFFSQPPSQADKLVKNERVKLRAAYLNTVAAGFAVTGVVGPVASYLYGTVTANNRSALQLTLEAVGLLGFSASLHALAVRILGDLEQ